MTASKTWAPGRLDGDPHGVPGAGSRPRREEGAQRRAGGAAQGELDARRGHRGAPTASVTTVCRPVYSTSVATASSTTESGSLPAGRVVHVLGAQAQHHLRADVVAQRRWERPPQRQRAGPHLEAGLPGGGHQPGRQQADRRGSDEAGDEQVDRRS